LFIALITVIKKINCALTRHHCKVRTAHEAHLSTSQYFNSFVFPSRDDITVILKDICKEISHG